MLWGIINKFNDILINTLTCESGDTGSINELKDKWYHQLHYSTDSQINSYLSKYGKYYSVENDGRFKCESILLDYFINNNIDVFYI